MPNESIWVTKGMPTITVLDYGRGNLKSVSRAVEYCGAHCLVTSDPNEVENASHIILPGVGAFGDAMSQLRERGLIGPIQAYCLKNRPFLGICLGMQLMFNESEEFGLHFGLGLIAGRVEKIPETAADGSFHCVPHIGWNTLCEGRADWAGTILEGVPMNGSVYFVHSYAAVPESAMHILAYTDYHGRRITAAVRSGRLFGCQFHPEKSGVIGLNIIRNFCSL